jgi:Fe-S-cluster containining protein
MKSRHLLNSYELLIDKADEAFRKVQDEYGDCIKCRIHCSDCCHAVFGLFLIEALYIQDHFQKLDENNRSVIFERCKEADADLKKFEDLLKEFDGNPDMMNYAMAKQRIRCPLLGNDDECAIYDNRPITCRVYGIPVSMKGKARVCGKSGFKDGATYPVFNLDGVYRDMFTLSNQMLREEGVEDTEKASLLISVSKILQTPFMNLIKDSFGLTGKAD